MSAGEFWGRTLLMIAFCLLAFLLAFGDWHRAPAQHRPVDLPTGPQPSPRGDHHE